MTFASEPFGSLDEAIAHVRQQQTDLRVLTIHASAAACAHAFSVRCLQNEMRKRHHLQREALTAMLAARAVR